MVQRLQQRGHRTGREVATEGTYRTGRGVQRLQQRGHRIGRAVQRLQVVEQQEFALALNFQKCGKCRFSGPSKFVAELNVD